MTAFGKTIVGKILKGAAIAGGSILGLGAGIGLVKGTGAVAGAAGALGGAKKVVDKVGASAVNLITGTTQAERQQVRAVKDEAKAAKNKLEQVDRLVKAGADIATARAMVGLTNVELSEYDGKQIQSAGIGDFLTANKKVLMIAGAVIAALFILPKIKKLR